MKIHRLGLLEKNRTIVEYSLKEANKPINVATYHMFSELPKELRKELEEKPSKQFLELIKLNYRFIFNIVVKLFLNLRSLWYN